MTKKTISTHCFLFLQNAYKCTCSPRIYVVKVVPEHLYIAMMDSLRLQFYPRMRLAGRDRKISDSQRKGYSCPMCEITDKDFHQQCPLPRSNNGNNLKMTEERERERENISVGFEPGTFKRKKIIPILCLIPKTNVYVIIAQYLLTH